MGYIEELNCFFSLQDNEIMVNYESSRIATKATICLRESLLKKSVIEIG